VASSKPFACTHARQHCTYLVLTEAALHLPANWHQSRATKSWSDAAQWHIDCILPPWPLVAVALAKQS
jgi:hypothetical protein